ncbi:MAG: hypothetical protein NVS3B16_27390 [Vulcanimicrobiaceae bacterium]
MMASLFVAQPALAEIAELQVARTRAVSAGDVDTAIAIGNAFRRALDRRRTEQVAKRRLVRRPPNTP